MKNKGFTLIEMAMVIVIVGLAAVIFIKLLPAIQRYQSETARRQFLDTLNENVKSYIKSTGIIEGKLEDYKLPQVYKDKAGSFAQLSSVRYYTLVDTATPVCSVPVFNISDTTHRPVKPRDNIAGLYVLYMDDTEYSLYIDELVRYFTIESDMAYAYGTPGEFFNECMPSSASDSVRRYNNVIWVPGESYVATVSLMDHSSDYDYCIKVPGNDSSYFSILNFYFSPPDHKLTLTKGSNDCIWNEWNGDFKFMQIRATTKSTEIPTNSFVIDILLRHRNTGHLTSIPYIVFIQL